MTFLYIPSGKFLEAEISENKCGVAGYFTLQARKKNGALVRELTFKADREIGPFHNLIVNQGLNRLATNSSDTTYRYCHVGVGTTAPSFTDSGLANFVSSILAITNANGNSGAPLYYSWRRLTWTSTIGAIPASNLTEVGVSGTAANASNLFSRELIRDGSGNPTSFPIAIDEQLTVVYELRLYPPLGDVAANVLVGSTNYATVTRACDISNSSVWGIIQTGVSAASFQAGSTGLANAYSSDIVANTLVPATALPSGSANSTATQAYVANSYESSMSATWGISNANGNIRCVTMAFNACRFQIRFDPVIVKTNTQQLILNQKLSWARV